MYVCMFVWYVEQGGYGGNEMEWDVVQCDLARIYREGMDGGRRE